MFDPLCLGFVGDNTGCDKISFFSREVRMSEPFFREVSICFTSKDFPLHGQNVAKKQENSTFLFFFLNTIGGMISLALLFLLVPVYFSHLLAPFDIFLNLDAFFSGAWTEILTMSGSSFERYKTYLFLVFLVSACFEIGFTHTKFFVNSCKKYWKWLMIFLLVPMISYLLYDLDTTLFFIGSEEKHHGYIWYAGFVVLTFLLTMLTFQEKKKLIIVSMG